MSFLFPILTIAGGLIAASSFLIAKKPDAKRLFEKVAPYQGMIGLAMLVLASSGSSRPCRTSTTCCATRPSPAS